ncbi:E3 ubiquitin-protein ligase TRIP12 [Strongyloides ratti]|uniref:E3 ubiquitin-protein ligase n=1 Tax=Strongyloides ratti TaxID=34506 RepID=A0A090MU36_STRRB|nr:E3 ubiquitin-protein ligase TRIP12 [Strongyloides ratti]CEF61963.1 E3 ubiquitin-protein ligase TRIP12 [Strongyloides ratti]
MKASFIFSVSSATTDNFNETINEDGISTSSISSSSSESPAIIDELNIIENEAMDIVDGIINSRPSPASSDSSSTLSASSKVSRCRRAAGRILPSSINLSKAKKNRASNDESSSSSSSLSNDVPTTSIKTGECKSSKKSTSSSMVGLSGDSNNGSSFTSGGPSSVPKPFIPYANTFSSGSSASGASNLAHAAGRQLMNFLGPRMSMFGGSGLSGHPAKIMEDLTSNEELIQLTAANDLAETLIMHNEDNMPPFPIKEVVQILIQLLQKEHNYELMLVASRCISNLLEVLPRTYTIVNETVPYLLQKLERIECIDVAEQCLIALEHITRRSAKLVLNAGGIPAAISHVDFFSMPSQRLSFQIAANCANHITSNEFGLIKDSVSYLVCRLNGEDDKRILESICTFFYRAVENLQGNPNILRQLIGNDDELLKAIQNILTIQGNSLSTNTFQNLIKMIRQICSKCTDKAVVLLSKLDFAQTIRLLIVGKSEKKEYSAVDFVSRPSNQLFELIQLMGELIPDLATDGVFQLNETIDQVVAVYMKSQSSGSGGNPLSLASSVLHRAVPHSALVHALSATGQPISFSMPISSSMIPVMEGGTGGPSRWRNLEGALFSQEHQPYEQCMSWFVERDGGWRGMSPQDNIFIEKKQISGEIEFTFNVNNSEYFGWHVNLRTGTIEQRASKISYNIDKKLTVKAVEKAPLNQNQQYQESSTIQPMEEVEIDERKELLKNNPTPILVAIQLLFPILVQIGENLSSFHLRYKSLRVMMRMIAALDNSTESQELVSRLQFSGYLANCLSTLSNSKRDMGIVVSAIQIVHILIEKFPNVFTTIFKRDGVFFEIEKLSHIKDNAVKPLGQSTNIEIDSNSGDGFNNQQMMAQQISFDTNNGNNINQQRSSFPHTINNEPQRVIYPSGRNDYGYHVNNPYIPTPSSRSSAPSTILALEQQYHRQFMDNMYLTRMQSHMPSYGIGVSPYIGATSSNIPPHPSTMQYVMRPQMIPTVNSGRDSLAHITSWINGQGTSSSLPSTTSTNIGLQKMGIGKVNLIEETIKPWIAAETKYLLDTYCYKDGVSGCHSTDNIVDSLTEIATSLNDKSIDTKPEIIKEMMDIFMSNDISPFQITKSGLIGALTEYLTDTSLDRMSCRYNRLQNFMGVFFNLTTNNGFKITRLEDYVDASKNFGIFVNKVVSAVNQLEQFQVKTFDLAPSSSSSLQGLAAMKFFNQHQIRCQLKKHPSCMKLGDWRHSNTPIKVDAFTTINSILRYLFERGIGSQKNTTDEGEDSSDADMMTDEELEERINKNRSKISTYQGQVELLINDRIIPKEMTMLQAVRTYGLNLKPDDTHLPSNIWNNCFTMYYRAVEYTSQISKDNNTSVDNNTRSSPFTFNLGFGNSLLNFNEKKKTKKDYKSKPCYKLWFNGEIPEVQNQLDKYLADSVTLSISDPSLPSIILLKVLYGLNRYYWTLFTDENSLPLTHKPLISNSSFVSSKLNAKAIRQLSDFVAICTQSFPSWLIELIHQAPFLFSFPTRRNFFYFSAFGKDRAMVHMAQSGGADENDQEGGSKYLPNREKKKVVIKRDSILKQTQSILSASNKSRVYMDVEFEGEVGTGYGPTLEFYSLISSELQKHSLKLWRGTPVKRPTTSDQNLEDEYTYADNGLYPAIAYSNHSKTKESRIKKMEMLGRLMGQTLYDNRMLDIPFNSVIFKWLLNDTNSFTFADLEEVDGVLYDAMKKLMETDEKDFEAVYQFFTLPGNDSFELIKGGKNKLVTKENVSQFVKLVSHWILKEGIISEMEAMKNGFEAIINIKKMKIFYPEELGLLLGGVNPISNDEFWEIETLKKAFKPDHGYSHDSAQVKWLIEMLFEFNGDNRRKFLQFVTGSPRLPVGGFRSLCPALTIVKKTASNGKNDEELPSAMTCYNYLKIPPYSTKEVFLSKFDAALNHIYMVDYEAFVSYCISTSL